MKYKLSPSNSIWSKKKGKPKKLFIIIKPSFLLIKGGKARVGQRLTYSK